MTANAHQGMLAIWHDVAEGNDAAVTDWYNTEHHAERLSVEGFLSAHRYRLAGGEGRQFFSLYRTRSPDVLSSAAYRARVEAPTPRTRAIMPTYRNVSRTVCRLEITLGRPEGGGLAALAGTLPPPDWKIGEAFAALLELRGVLRCRWLLAEAAAMPVHGSSEATLRGSADSNIAWAALIDANEPEQSLEALARLEALLQPLAVAQRAAYRLVYAASGAS